MSPCAAGVAALISSASRTPGFRPTAHVEQMAVRCRRRRTERRATRDRRPNPAQPRRSPTPMIGALVRHSSPPHGLYDTRPQALAPAAGAGNLVLLPLGGGRLPCLPKPYPRSLSPASCLLCGRPAPCSGQARRRAADVATERMRRPRRADRAGDRSHITAVARRAAPQAEGVTRPALCGLRRLPPPQRDRRDSRGDRVGRASRPVGSAVPASAPVSGWARTRPGTGRRARSRGSNLTPAVYVTSVVSSSSSPAGATTIPPGSAPSGASSPTESPAASHSTTPAAMSQTCTPRS